MLTLGKAIRMLRNARDITCSELALSASVSTPMISQIEAGNRQPSSRTLIAIAKALNVPTIVLVMIETQVEEYAPGKRAKDIYASLLELDAAEQNLRLLLQS